MKNQPKISVILPVYNAEKYLIDAIDSILNQTYINFELIIINDGSTDGSALIIAEKGEKDKRIVSVINEKNKGLIFTLNRGFELANGEYIARMDADDISLPSRFLKQIEYLEKHQDIVALGTNYEFFGNEAGFSNLKTNSADIKLNLYFENTFAHPTVMMRTAAIKSNKLVYNAAYLHLEDWGLWLDLLKYGKLANLSDCLLKYRIEGQNISLQNSDTFEQRAKLFYKNYIPNIYKQPLSDQLIANHWKMAKVIFDFESVSELLDQFTVLKNDLINSNEFDNRVVDCFIEEKKKAFFYKIVDQSKLKGLTYLFKAKLFSATYLRYLLGAVFSKKN